MSFIYNAAADKAVTGATGVTGIAEWANQYKEQSIEIHNSRGMFDLASPDDSLLVAGPARFAGSTQSGDFYVIGVCQQLQIQEQSNVQPIKSIGTRRMMFTKSNAPVSISIGRMMFYGKNLARALYTQVTASFADVNTASQKFAQGGTYADSKFLTNLEEDLYRTPFGLGIIYHTPRTASYADNGTNDAVGAEFAECCYLVSRATSVQSGLTTIMENVQILADRIVPWGTYKQASGTSVASMSTI